MAETPSPAPMLSMKDVSSAAQQHMVPQKEDMANIQKSQHDFNDPDGAMIGASQTAVIRLHASQEVTTMNIEGSLSHVRQAVSDVQGAVMNLHHGDVGVFRQVQLPFEQVGIMIQTKIKTPRSTERSGASGDHTENATVNVDIAPNAPTDGRSFRAPRSERNQIGDVANLFPPFLAPTKPPHPFDINNYPIWEEEEVHYWRGAHGRVQEDQLVEEIALQAPKVYRPIVMKFTRGNQASKKDRTAKLTLRTSGK